jgi:hypothetical protein
MKWMGKVLERVVGGSLLNPASWIGWALVLIGAWLLGHVLGWRADTAIISGTVDPARGDTQWIMIRGMFYALAYFGAVVVSPVLLLAAGIHVGIVMLVRRRQRRTRELVEVRGDL